VQVPRFWFIYVEEMARSSSPFRSLRVKQTGMGCFFASNHFEPNNFGNNGMIRSSAKNRPFSLRSILLASNALNFPFNFSSPTTREINLILCVSRRSLYCRCGSLVIKQTEVVRGSTKGWTIGILTGLSLWWAGICLTVTFSQICWSFAGSTCVSSNFSFFLISWE